MTAVANAVYGVIRFPDFVLVCCKTPKNINVTGLVLSSDAFCSMVVLASYTSASKHWYNRVEATKVSPEYTYKPSSIPS